MSVSLKDELATVLTYGRQQTSFYYNFLKLFPALIVIIVSNQQEMIFFV